MIYITGDTHGEEKRFANNNMQDENWTENDTLIVCGDFGFLLRNDPKEWAFLDYLEKEKPYTICFCDGNHECFPALEAFEPEDWNGGKIHRIRKNVIHLMRGQIYTLEGKTFFTFGGAHSVDAGLRQSNKSRWDRELPSQEECDLALQNLEKHGFAVDYIITHTAPQAVLEKFIGNHSLGIRSGFHIYLEEFQLLSTLGQINQKTEFRHWYFGHWHFDATSDQYTAVFSEIHSL